MTTALPVFAGLVALVTGGGSGTGEATAKTLAARGAAVVVADVDDEGGKRGRSPTRAGRRPLTRTWAAELAGRRIRVNILSLGG